MSTKKHSKKHLNHREHHKKAAHSAHASHNHHRMVVDFKKRFWVCLIATIPVLLLSHQIQDFLQYELRFKGDQFLLFLISSFIYFYGGYPFLKGMIDEIKAALPGMMTLISVAITTAYFYSTAVVFGLSGMVFYWELATLIDIMLLGHWIEMKSTMGAYRALEELARLMPSVAHKLLEDEKTIDVPVESLQIADTVLVKPGEKIPADGEVVEGESLVDESLLTGESKPVFKKPGEKVIGGSINGEGSLVVRVEKTGRNSFLSQVMELVRKAQESKSRTQDLANRAAFLLTLAALSGGAITFLVWYSLIRQDLSFSLERAVTVMVIACPHALGLAIPLVVAVSTSIAARKGLLIRNRLAFEKAKDIGAFIFDKTGTLTMGKFGVTNVLSFDERLSEEEILTYAASIEANSEHPIAKGIVSSADWTLPVKNFKSLPGKGVRGEVDNRKVMVVSQAFLKENNIGINDERLTKLALQGKTTVFVLIDGRLSGAIALADRIRPESKEAISLLKKMGIKCLMLTGDRREVAQWVAEEIGLDDYFAEVLPQEKAEKVREVQKNNYIVAMVGDGVNDAPALAQADVGIAIGAGTDVAIEAADIILIRNNPLDVLEIIRLARTTYSKMLQNLFWAAGYNIVAIPLAAGLFYQQGLILTPALGAILMSLSTIIVALNAQLLRDKSLKLK